MGFKRKKPTIVEMTFDGDYEGLEINFKVPSINQYLELLKCSGKLDQAEKDGNADAVEEGVDELARVLVSLFDSWNMTDDDDNPIELTKEELKNEELKFLMTVTDALANVMTDADSDLEKESTSGETSLTSLTMEAL